MTDHFSYPMHPPVEPLPRLVNIANPAAGAEINYPCPNNYRFKIIAFIFDLVSDATVVNRNVDLTINQGALEIYRLDFNQIHGAGFTIHYIAYSGMIQACFTIGLERICPLPHPIWLFHGQDIQTDTLNLQAGDQFQTIYLYGFAWPDFANNAPA